MDYFKLGQILQNARNEKGLKQSAVAAELNCTPANISSWERGKSKIDIDSFAELCKIYDIDFVYTLNQVANNSNPTEFTPQEKDIIKKYRTLDEYGKKAVDGILTVEHERCESANTNKFITLPFSLLKASAGTGEWLSEETTDTVKVLDTPQARKADIVIEVSGASMEPDFSDGDKVLVRKQPAVNEGEVGIFIINHTDGFIKQFAVDRLISLNPEWDDIYPSEDKIIECVGKVVGLAITYE